MPSRSRTGTLLAAACCFLPLAALAGAAPAGWTTLGLRIPLAGLVVDPQDSQVIYALGYSQVYKTTDRGARWSVVGTGIVGRIEQLAIDPQDAHTLYAVSSERPTNVGVDPHYRVRPIGWVYRTQDGGAQWDRVGGVGGGYINWQQTWSYHDVWMVVYPNDPRFICGIETQTDGGSAGNYLSITQDGGASWSSAGFRGARIKEQVIRCAAFDPQDWRTLLVVTHDAQDPSYSFVYRSTDAGQQWAEAGVGLADQIRFLVVDPHDSQTLYAGALGGRIYGTTDGGERWTGPGVGLSGEVASLVVDPRDPQVLYAGGSRGLHRSTDGGGHWAAAALGLSAYVVGLAFDPLDARIVYAATSDGLIAVTRATTLTAPASWAQVKSQAHATTGE